MNSLMSTDNHRVNSGHMIQVYKSLEDAEKSLREEKSEPQDFLLIKDDKIFCSKNKIQVQAMLSKKWNWVRQITFINSKQNYEEWEKSIDSRSLLKDLQDSQIYLKGRICGIIQERTQTIMVEDDVLRRVDGQMEDLLTLHHQEPLSTNKASFYITTVSRHCSKMWLIGKLIGRRADPRRTESRLYFRIQAWSNEQQIGSTHYIDLPTRTKKSKVKSQNYLSITQPVNHESFNHELLKEIQTLKKKIKKLEKQNEELEKQNRIQAWSNRKDMEWTNFVDLEVVRHHSATSQSHSMGLLEEAKLNSKKSELSPDIQRLLDRIKQLNEENQRLLQSAEEKDNQQLCDKIEELEKKRESNRQIIQDLRAQLITLDDINQELSKDGEELRKKRKISSDG